MVSPVLSLATAVTNHAAPVVSIQVWYPKGGPVTEANYALTNAVPLQYWLTPGQDAMTLEWMLSSNHVYEVQENFCMGCTNWYAYARFVAPRDASCTISAPIYRDEPGRFFRIRSD